MTSKQLERMVKQLQFRKRLVDTVEELEETIKTFMTLERRQSIHTQYFTLRLVEGKLEISRRPRTDTNQLKLHFKQRPNFKQKEDFNNESIDPQKTIVRRTGLSEGRRV